MNFGSGAPRNLLLSLSLLAISACVVPPSAKNGIPSELNGRAFEELAPKASSLSSALDAASYGFRPEDSTRALQSAIDSGAPVIRVRDMGSPWIVAPIWLHSNQVIVFDPGVVVTAKAGAYRSSGACLFRAHDAKNILLIGYGAELRMRKDAYTHAPNERGEWRHAISLRGVSNSGIVGLRISEAGGDGIYIGTAGSSSPSRNIIVKDVDVEDCFRQGMSVTGVEGLEITGSRFAGTSGTSPEAGVDFEPNRVGDSLTGIVVTNSVFTGNSGPGLLLYLAHLHQSSEPIDLSFRDCVFVGNALFGVRVSGVGGGVRGSVRFENCRKSWLSPIDSSRSLSVSWR